jgi:hypothetical protein
MQLQDTLFQNLFLFFYLPSMFFRKAYLLLFAMVLATTFISTGCSRTNDNNVNIDPFPELPEDNTGSRTRSITYVYDRRAVDTTDPPKIDSSVILFSYDPAGKIDRLRVTQNDHFVYDYSFERSGNRLTAIHHINKIITYQADLYKADLELQYNSSGNVSLMRAVLQSPSANGVDSFIIKSTGNRIDTVIDRSLAVGTDADKYAFTYSSSGDITQMDHIRTSGNFFIYEEIYKYTLASGPAALILGNEAILWYFFAQYVTVSGNTNFMLPPILFHSFRQPSKMVLQVSGAYTGTYNYQTEYYATGKPKKMTTNVITQSGAFYAREAYYYSYAQ